MTDGIILIDKPADMTSFGVVARIRRVLTQAAGKKVKVGHTGTLDPYAEPTADQASAFGAPPPPLPDFSTLPPLPSMDDLNLPPVEQPELFGGMFTPALTEEIVPPSTDPCQFKIPAQP